MRIRLPSEKAVTLIRIRFEQRNHGNVRISEQRNTGIPANGMKVIESSLMPWMVTQNRLGNPLLPLSRPLFPYEITSPVIPPTGLQSKELFCHMVSILKSAFHSSAMR